MLTSDLTTKQHAQRPLLHTLPVLWHALVLRDVAVAWVDATFLCLSHQQKAQAAMVAAAAAQAAR